MSAKQRSGGGGGGGGGARRKPGSAAAAAAAAPAPPRPPSRAPSSVASYSPAPYMPPPPLPPPRASGGGGGGGGGGGITCRPVTLDDCVVQACRHTRRSFVVSSPSRHPLHSAVFSTLNRRVIMSSFRRHRRTRCFVCLLASAVVIYICVCARVRSFFLFFFCFFFFFFFFSPFCSRLWMATHRHRRRHETAGGAFGRTRPHCDSAMVCDGAMLCACVLMTRALRGRFPTVSDDVARRRNWLCRSVQQYCSIMCGNVCDVM